MKTPTTKQLTKYFKWIDAQNVEPYPYYTDLRASFMFYGMLNEAQSLYIKECYEELYELIQSQREPFVLPEKHTSVDSALDDLFSQK